MEKEQKILKTLKDFGRLPTSRIMGIIGGNYIDTRDILILLHKSRKVKKTEETTATYWELTEIGKRSLEVSQ